MDINEKLEQEIEKQLIIFKEQIEPSRLQAFIDLPEKDFYLHDTEIDNELRISMLLPGAELYRLFEANGVMHPNDMTGTLLREWHRILRGEDRVLNSLLQLFQGENAKDNKKAIAFTGHRPRSLPWGYNEEDPRCIAFKEHLRSIIEKAIQNGYSHYLSGMAQGIDLIAARIVLDLKKTHSHITLEGVMPYEDQASTWPDPQREIYYNILAECDKTHIISKHYYDGVYTDRNMYLVQQADLLIAVFHTKNSGTSQTINLAKKADKITHTIDPTNIKG